MLKPRMRSPRPYPASRAKLLDVAESLELLASSVVYHIVIDERKKKTHVSMKRVSFGETGTVNSGCDSDMWSNHWKILTNYDHELDLWYASTTEYSGRQVACFWRVRFPRRKFGSSRELKTDLIRIFVTFRSKKNYEFIYQRNSIWCPCQRHGRKLQWSQLLRAKKEAMTESSRCTSKR